MSKRKSWQREDVQTLSSWNLSPPDNWLARLLHERQMRVTELAQAAELPASTISRLVRGQHHAEQCELNTLIAIAQALKLTLAELLEAAKVKLGISQVDPFTVEFLKLNETQRAELLRRWHEQHDSTD